MQPLRSYIEGMIEQIQRTNPGMERRRAALVAWKLVSDVLEDTLIDILATEASCPRCHSKVFGKCETCRTVMFKCKECGFIAPPRLFVFGMGVNTHG